MDMVAPQPWDLRLLPPALASWCVAWWALERTVPTLIVVGCIAGAVACASAGWAFTRHAPRHRRETRPGVPRTYEARGPVSASVALTALSVTATVLVCIGVLHAREVDPLTSAAEQGRPVTLEGTITSAPRALATTHNTSVLTTVDVQKVEGAASNQSVLVLGSAAWLEMPLGGRVHVYGALTPTDAGDRHVAMIDRQGQVKLVSEPSGQLAWVGRMRRGLVDAVGKEPTLQHLSQDERCREDHGKASDSWQERKDRTRRQNCGLPWPAGTRALVSGVSLGDDTALPTSVREEMRTVSMTHLTAVSGQHVLLTLGLVLGLTGMMPRQWRAFVGGVALIALVVLVRPSGSVLRAAVMGIVMLVGVGLGRRSASLPALCVGVLVVLLADPFQARDGGFVLSVAATSGIVCGHASMTAMLSRWLPCWCAGAVALPTVAQMACAPVLIALQPSVGVWSIPANVAAAPPVPCATVCGLVAACIALWSPSVASVVAWPAIVSCAWIASVAHTCAALPGASLPWPAGVGGVALMALLELTLCGLVCWWRHRRV